MAFQVLCHTLRQAIYVGWPWDFTLNMDGLMMDTIHLWISYGYYMLYGYYNTFIWINLEVKILGNVGFRTKPGWKLMTTDGGNTYKVSPHLVNVWVDQVDIALVNSLIKATYSGASRCKQF
jgi:hypothetical protein